MKVITILALLLTTIFASFQEGFDAYHQKNYPVAIDKWENACDNADGRACNVLALMYDNGEYVSQNRTIAKNYYKKACEHGDSVGCRFYERIEAQGL